MSVLENCGIYADKLTNITNIILNQKIEKGEKINNSVKDNVESELYSAYKNILTILKNDTTSIGTALIRLEIAAISGRTDDLTKVGSEIASSIAEKKAIHNYQESNISKNTYSSTYAAGITENITNNSIYKIFNDKFKDGLNELIDDAKTGDKEAIQARFWIERTTKCMADIDVNNLTDMQRRKILGHLFRLSTMKENIVVDDLIRKIGQECKFDIFSENTGEIDVRKIGEKLQEEVRKVNPNFNISFEEIKEKNENQKNNEGFIKTEEKRVKEKNISADKMQEEAEKEPEKKQLRKDFKQAFRMQMPEMIDNLIENSDEEVLREFITERIEICNNNINNINPNFKAFKDQTFYIFQRYNDFNRLNSIEKRVSKELFESNKENKDIYIKNFDEGQEF